MPTEFLKSVEAEATPHASSHRLFISDDGLRAGWSLLLFALLVVGLSALCNFVLFHLGLGHRPPSGASTADVAPHAVALQDGLGFVILAAAALVLSRIERRPFRRYGTPARLALSDFTAGLVWGFALLSALVGLLLATHHLQWDGAALQGARAWSYAAKWAFAFACVALLEEYSVRGYIQYTLARGVSGLLRAFRPSGRHSYAAGFWTAAGLLSVVLFAVAHLGNRDETAAGLLAVGLAGAVFAYSLWRTASLWWAIGFHAAWDWAQTFFYGTPDSGTHGVGHLFSTHPAGDPLWSGGKDGPEGSLLVIPVLLATLLIIHWTLPYRPRFRTPDQTPADKLQG